LETKLALERRIALEVLIEEAEGLANAVEIARASERLEALIFGAGDLSASLHARVDGNFDPVDEYPGDFWQFARAQVVTAARIGGIDAMLPIPRTRTRTGTAAAPSAPACSGSTAGGPSTPTRSPSPTRSSLRRHRRSRRPRAAIGAYRSAEAEGVGAIGRDGRLVDAAHVRLAANALHKASLEEGDR
jgi:citrate lyase subunit beta/citryl-CoA lyase